MNDNGKSPKVYYPGRDFSSSLEYSWHYIFHDMIKPFWRWLLIFLMLLVPILRFYPQGILLRAAVKRNHIRFRDDNAFGKGFGLWIITLIYIGAPLLILSPMLYSHLTTCYLSNPEGYLSSTGFWLPFIPVAVIILLIVVVFYIPGIVNYARNTFGYAFHFRENLQMIEDAGWLRYLGTVLFLIGVAAACFIVLDGISTVSGMVLLTLSVQSGSLAGFTILPLICMFIGLFLIPLFMAFAIRFFGNIFPETSVISDEECLAKIESSIQRTTGLKDTLEEHSMFREYDWMEAFLRNEENVNIIGNILREDENLLLSPEDIRYYMRVWFYEKCR